MTAGGKRDEFLICVNGKFLTMQFAELAAACPGVSEKTLRYRYRKGIHSLTRLAETTAETQARIRLGRSKLISGASARRTTTRRGGA